MALLLIQLSPARSQPIAGEPIIDMHLHAERGTSRQDWSAIVRDLETYNVVLAMLSIDDTSTIGLYENAPERYWLGATFPCYAGRYPAMDPCFEEGNGWPSIGWLREQFESRRMKVMGEMLYVYYGISPADEQLDPYWAMAEAFDIPVGVHIGRGPPPEGRAPGCCPHFDDDYGNPALLEPVLEKYPNLRIWLMHAGGRAFLDETITLMQSYGNVYAEMSIVNSIAPEARHTAALRAFVDAGVADRIMLGTDNMPIGPIIDRIAAVPFLSPEERRGIYCQNAARFLRLGPQYCSTAR